MYTVFLLTAPEPIRTITNLYQHVWCELDYGMSQSPAANIIFVELHVIGHLHSDQILSFVEREEMPCTKLIWQPRRGWRSAGVQVAKTNRSTLDWHTPAHHLLVSGSTQLRIYESWNGCISVLRCVILSHQDLVSLAANVFKPSIGFPKKHGWKVSVLQR